MSQRPSSLWRHRDFMKLWTGQSISVFGSLISRVALPMMVVLLLHVDAMQVSYLRIVETAPGLLAGLFAGVWIDRLRRRPIMILADFSRAALLGVVPLLFLLGHLTMSWIYVIAFFVSILTIFFDVAYQAYLPTLVETDQLVDANSKLGATASIAEVTGFSLSGVLVQLIGGPLTILIDAISFLASAVSLLFIRSAEPPARPTEERESMWLEIREGVAALLDQPILRALAIADGISNMFGNIIGTVIVLFVLTELKLPAAWTGVIFGLGGISSFFGSLLAGPVVRRLGLGPAILWTGLISALAVGFLPLAMGSVPVIILCLVAQQLLGDGAATIYIINATSLRQAITPERVMGRVSATLRVSEWAFMLVGTVMGGVLGETIGLRGALVVAMLGQLAAMVWIYFSPVRHMKSEPMAE